MPALVVRVVDGEARVQVDADGGPSRRRTRAQRAWNVPMATWRPASPTRARIRSRISAAALLVNVTARICQGARP